MQSGSLVFGTNFVAAICLIFAVAPVPALSQTGNSSVTTIVVESSGSCINVDSSLSQIGLGIDQWGCTGTSNQKFIFTPTSDGFYTIQAQNDNLCLDAGNGSVTTAVQVVQNTCTGGTSQKWRVVGNSDGSYTIPTYNGAGCLDVYAGRTANGTILTTYACHGSNNEAYVMAGFQPSAGGGSSALKSFIYTMVIESSNSCAAVNEASTQSGAGINEWTCSGATNQSFAFNPTSDGYYTIQPQNDNLCLDAGVGSVTTGVQIVQNACTGGTSQKWKLLAQTGGSYAITTPNGAGCFDVYAGQTANGTILTTYACHGSNNESFYLEGYSSGGSQTVAPTIAPIPGIYASPVTVTLTPAVSGTPIYYTTNGSTPSTSSAQYSGPISLTASATVKAIAVANGSAASPVVTSAFAIEGQTGAPTIAPTAGTYASPLTVTITPGVSGTPIYYTTNGSAPSTSSTQYLGPIRLTASATVRAIAVANGSTASPVVTSAFTIEGQTGAPTIAPTAGTYASPLTVTITPAASGTPIYYTTNGSAPSTSSTQYLGPIPLTASATVRAIAVANGSTASPVVTSAFTIEGQTGAPTIAPGAGTYASPVTVTITPAVSGTPIYYTTNGSTPSTSSTQYSGPIALTTSAMVKAIAVANGSTASPVVTSAFAIEGQAGAPTIAPTAGTYASPLTVTITPRVSGTPIYYTTNGSTPSTSSTQYLGPISLTASATVKAIAVANGDTASPVVTSAFTIEGQTGAPTIAPAAGTYASPVTVSITPAISGTPIYYSTNGSTPSTSSTPYSGPISLTASATVEAIAVANGSTASPVVSSSFTVTKSASGSSVTTMVVESSGSCINVDSSSSQVGLGIDQWSCTGTSNQNFIFTPTSDGFYTIQAQNDNLCLDAGNGSVTTAVQVVQNTCTGGTSQKWRVVGNSDGSYTIPTYNGAGCLDVYAGRTANGTILTTYACHGSNNEAYVMAGFQPSAGGGSSALKSFIYTMVIESSNSCVAVNEASTQSGAGINEWTCSGATNQSFAFNPTSDGYYTIQPQNDNLCLDAGVGSVTTGVQIVQNVCTGGTSQKWKLLAQTGGSYAITTPNGAGCFDVYAGQTANGTILTTYACHGSNNESFYLEGYSSGGSQTVAPTIAPISGTYASPLTVTLTPAISGTPIYYTTNGSIPSTSSAPYSGPISLIASATVKAIAVANGDTASPVVSSAFTVQVQSAATPVIFNYSPNARPGDVIYVQGVGFDATSQVLLAHTAGPSGTQLSVVNRLGSSWLGAQIPQSWTGAMFMWISNSSGNSRAVKLNGAIPLHLDALQLVPGGAFRVLGRNVMLIGYTPSVIVDGQVATVDTTASTENMLVVTAPSMLTATASAVIQVDNGNGTGPAILDRVISVVSGSGDPFNLGVGWGAGFTFAQNVITVQTPCNGAGDDSGSIQQAINSAASSGGVVQLPAGTCMLANSLTMSSKVVLQGAGKGVTFLDYESNYPISTLGADLVGIRNFTLVNVNGTLEGLIWKQNTRSFLQGVQILEGVSRQLFLTGNQNFVVEQSDFLQGGSVGEQNPYLFNNCAGFVFSGNTSLTVDGSPTFQSVHDALILANHFTRNAVNQNESVIITTHQFVMDFAYRTSIIGNTFDVVNGPITNTNRNDGETLLTEGGGGNRTENLGTVASATSNSISDPSNNINVNPFGSGLPENYGVAIVSGTGAGQTREVVGYANSTLQVDHAWDVIPDSTSHYATFVWGLEKSLIEGNTLIGNPRGIWLYQTAVRDVDLSGNTITNGGGIFLRTFEQQSANQFDPMYNVRIANNTISNSDGVWMSYTNVVFVNQDVTNFGTADTGIDVRNVTLTANNPNVTSTTEDYADREGFMNVMRSETSGGQLTSTPMLLGTIFQTDQCLNCSTPFVIGTGDYGTILVGDSPSSGSPNFLSDLQILGPAIGGSMGTVVQ